MGLIDFVRDAGEDLMKKVGISGSAEEKGESLGKAVHDLGIPVDGLKVEVEGETARIVGSASSQADREKAVLTVGNVKGIAKVDDQIEVASAEPEATYYTVKSGDTLSKIAKAQYGDAMKYPVIFEANRPMLKDPDKIYPGQNLRIPPQ